jgi:hypothetical protein
VASWPVRVTFDEDASGAARALRFSEWRLARGAPAHDFQRIAA